MIPTVQQTVAARFPQLRGKRVLVAASGGADSTALALALRDIGCDVVLAHVHHGIRGKAADVEPLKARWEEALAEVNREVNDGIPCIVAVGTAFAEKPYDFADLMKIADARMYEDKRRKKKPGEEIR